MEIKGTIKESRKTVYDLYCTGDTGIFERKEMAEIGNLTPEEMNEYQQSLKIQRDNYAAMETVKNEGIEEERRSMAREMKKSNEPIAKIMKYTKLSAEEIEVL